MSDRIPLETKERKKRQRELWTIALLSVFFLVLTVAEFRLGRISSTLPFVNSIFFFGLLNINIIILIGLVWLVFRNIGKVFIERRNKLLGARLKTKLIIVFLGFSIIPTLVLFAISALYINSSFDKWFSIKIQNTLQASLDITRIYYRNAENTATHFAEHLSKGFAKSEPSTEFLESQRDLLALDAIEYYRDSFLGRQIAQGSPIPELLIDYPRMPLDVLDKAFAGATTSLIQHIGNGDLIRCLVPVKAQGSTSKNAKVIGVTVVNTYIPVSLINKVDEIASVFDDYKDTNPLKYPMKTTYFVILIMITLVIIFVAIWVGLYLARELTVPVERLVRGAQQVGAGNLDVRVLSSGHDEISVLVESFNRMTKDLKDNRARLIQAGSDLEKRTAQLEAVLANVGTGVLVVDRQGLITTFNRAISQLLNVPIQNGGLEMIGREYRQVLSGEMAPLEVLITRTFQEEQAQLIEQWTLKSEDAARTLVAIATALKDSDSSVPWGVVVAVDDMTHLVKGQREMAWREVARRIAHEIKNPLTPIKLSAQRLQRRLGNFKGRDGALLKECTDTIIKHTDELKEMVNEFSSFARFPEVTPLPNDLNEALKEVVALFQQAHPGLDLRLHAESRLPEFEFDRDQIKRVVINLLDNSISAVTSMPGGRLKSVRVETHFHSELQMAVVVVKDNGPGMSEEIRARVFEPYFSTKKEGTGLGLAIAKRIVNDHDGFIRVLSAPGEGTQFFIELPTAGRPGVERRSSRFDTI